MSIFNAHVGRKLRDRRLSLGLTQTKVGSALGFSFQQIQKYEKGVDGITSEKLLDLANFLKVPITFFYEGYEKYIIPIPPREEANEEPLLIKYKEGI